MVRLEELPQPGADEVARFFQVFRGGEHLEEFGAGREQICLALELEVVVDRDFAAAEPLDADFENAGDAGEKRAFCCRPGAGILSHHREPEPQPAPVVRAVGCGQRPHSEFIAHEPFDRRGSFVREVRDRERPVATGSFVHGGVLPAHQRCPRLSPEARAERIGRGAQECWLQFSRSVHHREGEVAGQGAASAFGNAGVELGFRFGFRYLREEPRFFGQQRALGFLGFDQNRGAGLPGDEARQLCQLLDGAFVEGVRQQRTAEDVPECRALFVDDCGPGGASNPLVAEEPLPWRGVIQEAEVWRDVGTK